MFYIFVAIIVYKKKQKKTYVALLHTIHIVLRPCQIQVYFIQSLAFPFTVMLKLSKFVFNILLTVTHSPGIVNEIEISWSKRYSSERRPFLLVGTLTIFMYLLWYMLPLLEVKENTHLDKLDIFLWLWQRRHVYLFCLYLDF